MKTKYATIQRIAGWETSISFLSNYIRPEDEIHFVVNKTPDCIIGENKLEEYNAEFTDDLKRLSEINKERQMIIDKFLNYPK
jgi:hypothetical protein